MSSSNLEFKGESVNRCDLPWRYKHALGIVLKRTCNQEVHTKQNAEITS